MVSVYCKYVIATPQCINTSYPQREMPQTQIKFYCTVRGDVSATAHTCGVVVVVVGVIQVIVHWKGQLCDPV